MEALVKFLDYFPWWLLHYGLFLDQTSHMISLNLLKIHTFICSLISEDRFFNKPIPCKVLLHILVCKSFPIAHLQSFQVSFAVLRSLSFRGKSEVTLNRKISRNKQPILCFFYCTLADVLLHFLSSTASSLSLFFFSVNGEILPRHSDLQLGPAGVFCVLYSSLPHLLSPPPPPFLLLLLLLLSFKIALRDGSAPETQGQIQARQLSSTQFNSEQM